MVDDTRDRVDTLAHDVRGFFHVVHTSLHVLRQSREDAEHFDSILKLIERDHARALPVLHELIELAKGGQGGRSERPQ